MSLGELMDWNGCVEWNGKGQKPSCNEDEGAVVAAKTKMTSVFEEKEGISWQKLRSS